MDLVDGEKGDPVTVTARWREVFLPSSVDLPFQFAGIGVATRDNLVHVGVSHPTSWKRVGRALGLLLTFGMVGAIALFALLVGMPNHALGIACIAATIGLGVGGWAYALPSIYSTQTNSFAVVASTGQVIRVRGKASEEDGLTATEIVVVQGVVRAGLNTVPLQQIQCVAADSENGRRVLLVACLRGSAASIGKQLATALRIPLSVVSLRNAESPTWQEWNAYVVKR